MTPSRRATYVLLCRSAGVYDEKVLVGLDFAINEASKRGIRVVPVFANYWAMYGGIDQYNTWSFEAGSGEPLAYPPQCCRQGLLKALRQIVWQFLVGLIAQSCRSRGANYTLVRWREECMLAALTYPPTSHSRMAISIVSSAVVNSTIVAKPRTAVRALQAIAMEMRPAETTSTATQWLWVTTRTT